MWGGSYWVFQTSTAPTLTGVPAGTWLYWSWPDRFSGVGIPMFYMVNNNQYPTKVSFLVMPYSKSEGSRGSLVSRVVASLQSQNWTSSFRLYMIWCEASYNGIWRAPLCAKEEPITVTITINYIVSAIFKLSCSKSYDLIATLTFSNIFDVVNSYSVKRDSTFTACCLICNMKRKCKNPLTQASDSSIPPWSITENCRHGREGLGVTQAGCWTDASFGEGQNSNASVCLEKFCFKPLPCVIENSAGHETEAIVGQRGCKHGWEG